MLNNAISDGIKKRPPNIGIALLAWKSLATLEGTLSALQAFPENMFADRVIFFQEISDEDRSIAEKFNFRAEGNDQNRGIREGIKQAISHCRADVVLFLECDCLLIESINSAKDQILNAAKEITRGELSVVRMRHIDNPGDDYDGVGKFSRYWPLTNNENNPGHFLPLLRRTFRPFKARRLIGQAVMAGPEAAIMFPQFIKRVNPGLYSISSKVIPWTNQAILVNKDWVLGVIIPFAEANPTSRGVNSFPDLEKELNCRWWYKQGIKVGQSIPGLFSHYRIDRPKEDEKTMLHKRFPTSKVK